MVRYASLCWLLCVLALWSPANVQAQVNGLSAEYYDTADFTALTGSTVDPTVDFNWGIGAPRTGMGPDTFSVLWRGEVEPEHSGSYTFYVTADDGFRLWVDNRLVMARTSGAIHAPEMAGRLELEAHRRYSICLQYMEQFGDARVRLEWASEKQPRQVIPSSRLFPAQSLPERGTILAETWTDISGTNINALNTSVDYPARPSARESLLRFDCLVTNWADHYGTRVSGWLVPQVSGNYTFAVAGDDAVQLSLSTNASYLGLQLIASNSTPTLFRDYFQQPGQVSGPVYLEANARYFLELLHKESTGDDHYSVAWQKPGDTTFEIIPGDCLVPSGTERVPPPSAAFLNTLSPEHPRLFGTAQRFESVRRQIRAGAVPQINQWWLSLSNSASILLSAPVVQYTPDERGTILGTSREVVERIYKLAFAWQITTNSVFAERAWAELQQVSSTNFPDWHPAHFLDTAEMTHACAVGYDWLYHYWSPGRRDLLRQAIIDKGLTRSLTLYTNNSGWVNPSANNWNLVCNGGMILGALAIGAENEALSEYILSKAVASAALVMRRFGVDNGAWYEGPGYWSYTTDYNILLLAALESALGSDLGLSDTPGLSETGLLPIYAVGPTRLSFNFADAGAGNIRGPQLFWLARRFNRPDFSAWERANGSGEALDLLWYDLRGSDPGAAGLPSDNFFKGVTQPPGYKPSEMLTMRGRWQDSQATFAGFKAGEIGADHGNLDAGTFVLDALGNRWAHDLGGDSYALPGYFSEPQRWTYYRMRAEGQNTLVINPGSGPDQVVNAVPPVIFFTSEPDGERSAAVADLTSAYGVARAWRGVQLFNRKRWFLVQDEIEAAQPAQVWWFMHFHTNTAAQIAPGGGSVMMTRGSARLWVSILSSNATITISNAVPLPTSPNPAGQNPNLSLRKLAIRLQGVTNTTLSVLMVPLRPGEPIPQAAGLPAVVPLTEWGAGTTNTVAARTNTAPLSKSHTRIASPGSSVDVDLRSLVADAETPTPDLLFRVTGSENGSAYLLADGYTARFTPLPGYTGPAAFGYSVQDTWPDQRLVLHYDFEGPDTAAAGYVLDRSGNDRFGEIVKAGMGQAAFDADTPAALNRFSRSSLLLKETGDFHGARLNGRVAPIDLDFNRSGWTFSGWFQRAAATNDDFIFYLGTSDGFGSPDELHLHASGSQNLSLVHFYGSNASDLDLRRTGVLPGQWNHVAVTYKPTVANQGTAALYVNGVLAGTDSQVTLNMPSGEAPILGGHANSNFAVTRWFNGRLDDCAVFGSALDPSDITRLAGGVVAHLGGAITTNVVYLHLGTVPAPKISGLSISNRQAHVSIPGLEGFQTLLQNSPSLSVPHWTSIATNAGAGPVLITIPVSTNAPQQFYRLFLLPL